MAITLDQFRTISNGTHNVGQIMLNDDGDGLQKINNHVWQTSKNNVMTEAYDNRSVRQALYDAFSSSGKLSPAMLNDIKTILLGGTNGSRSLSRDFVKKLFDTVDHAHEGDDIVNMMNVVSKSLSERKVSVVKNDLVTSSKGAAYEIYASEKMDICASKGQEGLRIIRDTFKATGSTREFTPQEEEAVRSSLKMMTDSLFDMIMNDKSLRGGFISQVAVHQGAVHGAIHGDRDIQKLISDKLNEISEKRIPIKYHTPMQGAVSFIRQFKDAVEQVYNDLGLGFKGSRHLDRLIPPDFMDA